MVGKDEDILVQINLIKAEPSRVRTELILTLFSSGDDLNVPDPYLG